MEVDDRHRWTRREPLYPIVIKLFGAVLRLLFDVRFGGRHLPPTGPAIIAANHVHRLDAVVFGCVAFWQGRKARFLALADLWDVFGLRWLLEKGRMIPVHRGAGPFRMVQDARAALEAGEVVVIYPEGHLVPGRDDLPAQPGTGLLALTTDAPVIPMALWGLRGDQRYGRAGRRRIGVAAGDPVDVSQWRGRTDERSSRAAADAILAAVRAQVPRAERLARGAHG